MFSKKSSIGSEANLLNNNYKNQENIQIKKLYLQGTLIINFYIEVNFTSKGKLNSSIKSVFKLTFSMITFPALLKLLNLWIYYINFYYNIKNYTKHQGLNFWNLDHLQIYQEFYLKLFIKLVQTFLFKINIECLKIIIFFIKY